MQQIAIFVMQYVFKKNWHQSFLLYEHNNNFQGYMYSCTLRGEREDYIRPWRLQCSSYLALGVVDGHSESTASDVSLLYNCVGYTIIEHYTELGHHIQLYFSNIIIVKVISLQGISYVYMRNIPFGSN